MNVVRVYRIAAMVVPMVTCLVGIFVIVQAIRRLRGFQVEQAHTQAQVTAMKKQIAETPDPEVGERVPTAEQTRQEQPLFLNTLRSYADGSRVEIVRWSNLPPPKEAANTDDKEKKKLPPNVTPVASAIEIKGRYNDLRQFLYKVLYCPRLISMHEVKWVRGDKWPNTRLVVTLTRYVTPPTGA